MGNPRVSTFVIVMIWIGFLATVIGLFLSGLTDSYTVDYDSSNVEAFNKLTNLSNRAEEYQAATDISEKDASFRDIVGGYFSAAYSALRTTMDSIDLFNTMTTSALENENLNFVAGKSFRIAITTTVIILFVIGIILSATMKWKL